MSFGAYGKDPSQLDGSDIYGSQLTDAQLDHAYRQGQQANRYSGGGGSSSRKKYVDTYPQPEKLVRLVRFIRHTTPQLGLDLEGNVVTVKPPYFHYVEHYQPRNKQRVNCSAGPLVHQWARSEPCHACTIYRLDSRAKGEHKRSGAPGEYKRKISLSDKYAVTLWDYGPFMKVPVLDRATQQPRLNRDGVPYYNWAPISEHSPQAQQQRDDVKWGMRWPFVMNQFTRGQFMEYNNVHCAPHCASCSQGHIVPVSRNCIKCGGTLFDYASTTLSPEQITKYEEELQECPHCRHKGYTLEVVRCTACNNPRRSTIFDVDVQISFVSQGENKGKSITWGQKSLPRPIQLDAETAKKAVALPLEKMFAPHTLEEQVERLQLPPDVVHATLNTDWNARGGPSHAPEQPAANAAGFGLPAVGDQPAAVQPSPAELLSRTPTLGGGFPNGGTTQGGGGGILGGLL